MQLKTIISILVFIAYSVPSWSQNQPASDYRIYPYLQNPTQSAISILWFTESAKAGILTYQKSGSKEITKLASSFDEIAALTYSDWEAKQFFKGNPPATPFRQRVRIEGLEPATVYQYTVIQAGELFSSAFKTAPAGYSPIRVIVYGDDETEPESTGTNVDWQLPISPAIVQPTRKYLIDQTQGYKNNLEVIKSRNPDLIIIAGDLVQTGGEQRDWDEFWQQNNNPTLKLASAVPIMPTFGNHEYYAGPNVDRSDQSGSEIGVQKYLNYFELPANHDPIKEHEERYYSFNYGPATFIMLDVSNNSPEDSSSDTSFYLNNSLNSFSPGFAPHTRQYQWLEETLKDAQKRSLFTFIAFHHSPYSSGPHGRPAGNQDGATDKQSGVPVRALTPLFMRYGVDAVLSGHDEMWERSEVSGEKVLLSGKKESHTIQFYDVGIGGDGLRKPRADVENPFQKFIASEDAPEIWEKGELVSGGRHYGHLELDINLNPSNHWQATLKPIYILPVKDANDQYTNYLRKSYDDQITIIKSAAD